VLALLIVLWPLFLVTFPPFLDYYSHLARVHITASIGAFSEFYAVNEITPPNVALDVIVGALQKIVPLETAGWLFIVSIPLIQFSGLWMLNRTLHGRQAVPIGPLLGSLIVYNSVLTMGFLSYLFGLGLMLWMFWLWLLVRERSAWIAVTAGTAATLVLYFAHIIVLGLYGIVVFGYELQRLLEDRKKAVRERSFFFLRSGIPFLPPALLYVTSFHGDMQLVQYSQNYLLGKLHAIIGILSTGSSPLILSVAGPAIVGALAMSLGRAKFSSSMILPVTMLTLMFLVAPTTLGDGRYFEDRLVLPIALLICACVHVEFRDRGRALAVMGALLAVLAIRGVDLSRDFMRFDAEVRRSLQLFERIEPRSTVAVAIDTTHPEYSWSARGRANWHVASLAALKAPIFVATTHAQPSQHTMVLKGAPFTDVYAWQKEIPVEITSGRQMNYAVSRFREITRRHIGAGEIPTRRLYFLLLMPHDLAETAGDHGIMIGRTKWFLLLQISAIGQE
jgi:hypothetical protein